MMGAEQIREKREERREKGEETEDDKECSFTTLLQLRFCISLIN